MKIRDDRVVSDTATSKRVGTRLLGYLALTKPRVVELLLVTTIPAMLLASRGIGKAAALLIALGTLLSAAMIWIIAFTGAHPFDPAVPIGGMLFLAGWLLVLWSAFRSSNDG